MSGIGAIRRQAAKANREHRIRERLSRANGGAVKRPAMRLKVAREGNGGITTPTIQRIQRLVLSLPASADMLRMRGFRAINQQDCTEAEGRAILDAMQAIND